MPPPELPADPMVRALIGEILARLADLLASGMSARIDLRRLPLSRNCLAALREWLEKGEIEASMSGVGSCSFSETGISGVWWAIQRNGAGEIVGEFIEIAMVPELLRTTREDVEEAVRRLQQSLEPPAT